MSQSHTSQSQIIALVTAVAHGNLLSTTVYMRTHVKKFGANPTTFKVVAVGNLTIATAMIFTRSKDGTLNNIL